MIVDDEPYIRQGLKILIPWKKYGYKICAEASNGIEALEKLKDQNIDLIITDIKMPQMDGIELIEYISEYMSKRHHFIILSGFYEFEYAKKAIRYGVEDYILKPVQKDELIRTLEDYKEKLYNDLNELKNKELTEKVVFDNHLGHLLSGVYSEESIDYISRFLTDISGARYIGLEYDLSNENYLGLSHDERIEQLNLLYNELKKILNGHSNHIYKEYIDSEKGFAVGLIYVDKLGELAGLGERDYIHSLSDQIKGKLKHELILYIGQKERDIRTISESYKTVKMIRSFYNVTNDNSIINYDDIKNSLSIDKHPVDKEAMDNLIRVIEENDKEMIKKHSLIVHSHFKDWLGQPGIIKINFNYLLFNFINLTREIDSKESQEEAYGIISRLGNDKLMFKSSIKEFQDLVLEFADYLSRERQHAFGGVLKDIEREIIENYMENLSLKGLSEKYFINSAYLGQIFKKQFGVPFKDYLNNYRIEKATELLIRTDEKIYLIASSVGFNNTDYFISKFVQLKGITPLQFRKQFIKKEI
jgi:two-component system response regulator YesN